MFDNKAGVIAGVLFGGILALGVGAIAEDTELDSGPRVFPYNGVLEFNGEVLNGAVDLRFTVTDEGDCDFEEEHDNVSVFGGRFATNIGSVAGDVPGCVFDSEQVFIKVAIREADAEGDYTELLGQQRIHPVPFAYWASEGSDFRTDGNLVVGGLATLTGDVGVGTSPGAAVVHIEGDDDDRPVFRSQQFTVDSEDNNGLINLVAGAATVGGSYEYLGTRGASRILLGDGELRFYVGAGNNDGQTAGTAVSFGNPLEVDANGLNSPDGSVTINDSFIVTGSADIRGSISDSNGDVTINDNLDITGNIQDTDGAVIIDDDAEVTETLYLSGSEDVSLARDGILVLGVTDDLNMAIDNNEIQARDNGAAAELNIQREGGTTRFHDNVRIEGNLAGLDNCAWSGCYDAPHAIACAPGQYMAGFARGADDGNDDLAGCGSNGDDDFRIYCCTIDGSTLENGGDEENDDFVRDGNNSTAIYLDTTIF